MITETIQSQRSENERRSMQQVYEFLNHANYYMLATVEGAQPRVRPFGTILYFEDKLYIETLHRKRTSQQLLHNNRVELCAMSASGDSWIRVAGTLQEDARIAPKKAMLDAYPFLRGEIEENDPELAVYYFDQAIAWISREGEPDQELRF